MTDKSVENENVAVTKVPVVPLRDLVAYRGMVVPLFVGRASSIQALELAIASNKKVFLITQKDSKLDNPKKADLHTVGMIATVLQFLTLPDGTVKVLVEGLQRARLKKITQSTPFISANLELIDESYDVDDKELASLITMLKALFDRYVQYEKKMPSEVIASLVDCDDDMLLVDTIAAHVELNLVDKQALLSTILIKDRINLLIEKIQNAMEILGLDKKIQGRVKGQMEKSQREYYLNEKMKAVQQELGELDESLDELQLLGKSIKQSGMSKEALSKAESELKKLKLMPAMSAEATVIRNYLDWLLDIPWKKYSKLNHSMDKALSILDEDHYGLDEIKQRILEYLAVQKRVKKTKGPILCFVGPPGVGKTSLGQSIARATGREFIRVSLGGVRDEAEIRGHRRTYIGAMPGKIMQKIARTKVKNPLFMLDEVDKMSMDFRGDPASALLEVLDPEQNNTFNDHYLEIDYDLSDVMFIATSNSLNMPLPLLDRMEIIRLAGYTEDEKLSIIQQYLLPKQLAEHGLKPRELTVSKGAMLEIIRFYTREAGVRGLEREIAKICRKIVKELLVNDQKKVAKKKQLKKRITQQNIGQYLGVRRCDFGLVENYNQVGQVTGLAWTQAGGDLLTIEATIVPGKGKSIYTGSLGEVMQESIQTALTVVRSRANILGENNDFYKTKDIHVHVPEGATPKDGPSAGVGMCTALVSALTNNPVKADVAMTGEITLRGEVLPIGGLKEKLLAALRGGIKTVIIPEKNKKDLKEIPKNVLNKLTIKPVRWIDQVFDLALIQPVVPDKLASAVDTNNKTVESRSTAKKDENSDRAH